MRSAIESPAPRLGDFLATSRGGGLYSETVSQPAGAAIALGAARLGLPPTALTMVNLALGVGAAVAVVAMAVPSAAGTVPHWLVGLIGLLAWQLGYAFDCADGQLARVTGTASPAGGRVDVLCDVAVQIGLVSALSAVAVAYRPGLPMWLPALFGGTWLINLFTSVLQAGPGAASLVSSRSVLVRVLKLVRDYGAITALAGLVILFVPQWTVAVLAGFATVNGVFLLASIAFAARTALRPALAPQVGVQIEQGADDDGGVKRT